MFARRTGWNQRENAYAAALRTARQNGVKLLDLTVSNPTECGFEFDSAAIASALAHSESLHYEPHPSGLLQARKSVAGYYNSRPMAASERVISPEQILLTTSTSEAYSFLFRLLCDPGDNVLVPRPSYPLFEFLADIQDVQLQPYPLFYDHGWHIDLGRLRERIGSTTRAILVVNPNNPTGSFVHGAELDALVQICSERDIALIADEVFLDYQIEAPAEASAAFCCGCLSFALSGLSKISCLPQMKLAWLVVNGPAALRQAALSRLEIIADTYLSVSGPIQHGVLELLDQRRTIQPQLLSRIRTNLGKLDDELKGAPSIQRLRVEGGWYAVLRVPAVQTDEGLCIELMNRGVVVHPGHFYDFSTEGHLVLSLIAPSDVFQDGIKTVFEVLSSPSHR
ncbi:MAG: pyridoxal phosphate-dependent aminotransferase [Acidobacteria bacterium]|nr:pyridoxal phosphate-dependent aminotransferase [Acidobacteriota bacterium]